jgi:hypothetical protein
MLAEEGPGFLGFLARGAANIVPLLLMALPPLLLLLPLPLLLLRALLRPAGRRTMEVGDMATRQFDG